MDEERSSLLSVIRNKNENDQRDIDVVVKEIQTKLDSHEKLTETEWNLIIRNLLIVGINALLKEEKYEIAETILGLVAKIGLLLGKKDGMFYNECYKSSEAFKSLKWEREVNTDFLFSIKRVNDCKKEERLAILLKQYKEAIRFHSSKDAYIEAYHNTQLGEVSSDERLFIHAFHRAYEEEKKLVKEQFSRQLISND